MLPCRYIDDVTSLLQRVMQAQGGDVSSDGAQDVDLGGPTGTGSVIVGSTKKGRAGRPDVWHRHNAIFVLNPSKVRDHCQTLNPNEMPQDAGHLGIDLHTTWCVVHVRRVCVQKDVQLPDVLMASD
jgi:hypothetical protein